MLFLLWLGFSFLSELICEPIVSSQEVNFFDHCRVTMYNGELGHTLQLVVRHVFLLKENIQATAIRNPCEGLPPKEVSKLSGGKVTCFCFPGMGVVQLSWALQGFGFKKDRMEVKSFGLPVEDTLSSLFLLFFCSNG